MPGSHDRSIRRWERTSEPFFVEEEKEKRLESLFEADLEKQQQQEAKEGEQVSRVRVLYSCIVDCLLCMQQYQRSRDVTTEHRAVTEGCYCTLVCVGLHA